MKTKNNSKLYLVVGLFVILLAGFGVVSAYNEDKALSQVIENVENYTDNRIVNGDSEGNLGAAAGPDHYFHQKFLEGYSKGNPSSRYATTTTASSYTLTTTELPVDRKYTYIDWNAGINTTLTTMASSSYPLIDLKVGEEYSVKFYSATSTAATTITFAAGTGVDLQEDEGGTVIVNGLELSQLTFIKKADTDVILLVEPYQVGD